LTRLEEGDEPDSRVPLVSDRSEKKKGRDGAGPAVALSWATGPVCSRGKEGKKKACWPGKGCGPKE
jgi:hypothetical protein